MEKNTKETVEIPFTENDIQDMRYHLDQIQCNNTGSLCPVFEWSFETKEGTKLNVKILMED